MKEKVEEMTVGELKDLLKSKKKRKRKKRKWRFSEKVIFGILLFSVFVYVSAIVYAYLKEDSSIWAYLIPSVGALASSGFAFFIWKEKSENLPKIIHNPNYDLEQMESEIRSEVEEEFRNLGR